MSTASLVAAVNSAIPAAYKSPLVGAIDPWDAFEAYAMTVGLLAAKDDGYTVRLVGLQAPGSQFVLRKGPGQIWSPHFSYLEIVNGATEAEMHVGIGVEGQSNVVHEADVCAVDKQEAVNARRDRFAPRAKGLIFLFECKYYAGQLGLGLIREFIGLTTDLRSHQVYHWLVSNVTHAQLATLLKHHNRDWADDVMPTSKGSQRLQSAVEQVLHRHRR